MSSSQCRPRLYAIFLLQSRCGLGRSAISSYCCGSAGPQRRCAAARIKPQSVAKQLSQPPGSHRRSAAPLPKGAVISWWPLRGLIRNPLVLHRSCLQCSSKLRTLHSCTNLGKLQLCPPSSVRARGRMLSCPFKGRRLHPNVRCTGRGDAAGQRQKVLLTPTPPGSPMRRAQRNPHQLDTLTSAAAAAQTALQGVPELSLGESASPLSSIASPQPPADHIQITLHDRVAFASRFLSDDAFVRFVERIRRECLESGRVDGLLITGPTPTGAWLVQRYLDNTGDVQTAAVVGCYLLRAVQVCSWPGRTLKTSSTSPLAVSQLHLIKQADSGCFRAAQFADAASDRSAAMDASVGAVGSGVYASPASLPPWQLSDDMRRMGMLAWRWVAAYRDVLSQGQRWNERAMFDVQRAKLLAQRFEGATSTGAHSAPRAASAASSRSGDRTDLDRQAFAVLVSLTTWAVPLPPLPQLPRAEALGPGLSQRHGPVVIAPAAPLDPSPAAALRAPVTIAGSRPDTVCTVVPGRTASEHAASLGLVPAAAALFVRCSSCGASLALPALLGHSASSVEWLSKQRPHMLSCPGCRKSLPRWCVSGEGRRGAWRFKALFCVRRQPLAVLFVYSLSDVSTLSCSSGTTWSSEMQHRHPRRLPPLRATFLTPPLFCQPRRLACTRFAPKEICATLCSLMTCGHGARVANTAATLVTSRSGSRQRQCALSPSACVIACVLITSTRTVREEGGRAIACASMACHSLAEAFAFRQSRTSLLLALPVVQPECSRGNVPVLRAAVMKHWHYRY